jgi:hypothetical protein
VGMDAGLGRGGMDAGLGRGGIPAWLGRGIPAGEGRWLWPPETPKGLLPGLRAGGRAPPGPGRPVFGAPGAAVRPAAGEPGRGGTVPGPGPGGRGREAPSAGGCWARRSVSRWRAAWAALTAASCSALSAEARSSAAATSMSCALAGLTTGAAGTGGPGTGGLGRFIGPGVGAGALGTPGAGAADGAAGRRGGMGRAVVGVLGSLGADGADGAGAGAPPCDAVSAPRSRRATGASTVLDADLTNSPISLSLARTVLLSTPSSLASS